MVLDPNSKRFRPVEWNTVRVGDFVLVHNREPIPADLLVIGVHEPSKGSNVGMCYVESKSLDGETNLKIRQTIGHRVGKSCSPTELIDLRGRVVMEHPNKLIDSFTGTVEMEGGGARAKGLRWGTK
ncbi:unnamed protein product [Discosporangium mesarthrocarpum]